jgi:hypothetical protein
MFTIGSMLVRKHQSNAQLEEGDNLPGTATNSTGLTKKGSSSRMNYDNDNTSDQTVIPQKKKRGERGRSQATRDLIAISREIMRPIQPVTVRGVCYKLFTLELIRSMKACETGKISKLLVHAREDGAIPWEWIVDESRSIECVPQWNNLGAYAQDIESWYRRDFWCDQPYRVIVVSEKNTVGGLLRPTTDEYGVEFFPVRGFNSATKVKALADQIASTVAIHCVFIAMISIVQACACRKSIFPIDYTDTEQRTSR